MSGRSESMKLVKDLQRQGFTVVRAGSGHWKVTHPDRSGMVVMSFSPKSPAMRSVRKQLRDLGYQG